MLGLGSILLLTLGCDKLKDQISDIKDEYGDITNQFVVAGTYLGVQDPDLTSFMEDELCIPADAYPMDSSMYEQGNQVMIFLAEAELSSNIEDSQPVSRADVLLSSDDGTLSELILEEGIDGQYSAGSDQGFSYASGGVNLAITHSEIDHSIGVDAPDGADLSSVPRDNPSNTAITVDLTGQGFHEALLMVLNIETGDVVYDNLPSEDPASMYQLAHPEGSLLGEETPEVESAEIPGDAFTEDGLYAVGVAGIRSAGKDDMDNVNLLLSGLIAGKFSFTPVCVPDCETIKRDLACEYADLSPEECDLMWEMNPDGECPDLGGE
jgi:hypothetical protein